MSKDPQSESKSWWQTLPGLLTAGAAVITAFTGLIVAVNQTGLFHHSRPSPDQAQSKSLTVEEAAGPNPAPGAETSSAYDGPASGQLAIPQNSEVRTGQAVFKLLSARLSPYSPGQVSLQFTVRMTNNNNADANFWANSFRLLVNGSLQAPANDLDELVAANSSKEGMVEFVISTNTPKVGLQMGDVGEGKPALIIRLKNP